VTGLDSGGQLFRDSARVIFLKGQKCIYQSNVKPSPDSSVMVELRIGGENWRSDAKVRAVSSAGPEQDGFRVTLELDRASSAVVETAESSKGNLPSAPAQPPADAGPAQETTAPDLSPAQASADSAAGDPRPPAPAPSPAVIAAVVRSVMASEAEQRKRELQDVVAGQVEAALRRPLEKIEAGIGHLQRQPALTEESVRKIAARAAEEAQIEWGTASQKLVAETVRSAVAADSDQLRRDLRMLVSAEIAAALKGSFGARIDARVDETVAARMEKHSRTQPSITEDTVRRLAAQVAEGVQLQWATTKLQKMVAEAVRSAVTLESDRWRTEAAAMVSGEIQAALGGPLAAQMDAVFEKTVVKGIAQYFQTPAALGALQHTVAEAVRQPLEAEYEQRGRQVQAVVSNQIEAAVRGPIAAQMDEMLQGALDAQRAEYMRNPPPITEDAIRQITASIAQHPQLQRSIDALAATLSDRWTEIARGATATAQQDIGSRIAATERLTNQVVSEIQQKLDSFSAEMNRILGTQEMAAASADSQPAEEPERDKRFRELLQSTGSHFEREMKAALQKIFGKS
jgi:uncharacterized protein YneF (UPF0154 family)